MRPMQGFSAHNLGVKFVPDLLQRALAATATASGEVCAVDASVAALFALGKIKISASPSFLESFD